MQMFLINYILLKKRLVFFAIFDLYEIQPECYTIPIVVINSKEE